MTRISTCPYHGQSHPTFLHLLEGDVVQFCAYAAVLMVGMHGEQLNFSCLILAIHCIGYKSSDGLT